MRKTASKTKGQEGAHRSDLRERAGAARAAARRARGGDLRELIHTLGMRAIATMFEQERTELWGERYEHGKVGRRRADARRRPA